MWICNDELNASSLGYSCPQCRQEKQRRFDVQLSERLASLGSHVYQLEDTPYNPLDHHSTILLRGLREGDIYYVERG